MRLQISDSDGDTCMGWGITLFGLLKKIYFYPLKESAWVLARGPKIVISEQKLKFQFGTGCPPFLPRENLYFFFIAKTSNLRVGGRMDGFRTGEGRTG